MLVKGVGGLEEARTRTRRAEDTEVGLVVRAPGFGGDLVPRRKGVRVVVDVADERLSLRVGNDARSVVANDKAVDASTVHSRAAGSRLEVQSRVAEGSEHPRAVVAEPGGRAGDGRRSVEGRVAVLRWATPRAKEGEESRRGSRMRGG